VRLDASKNFDTLRTARLLAQRIRSDDCRVLARLYADPAVMATLGGVMPDVEARTRRFVDQMLEHWDSRGYGLYLLRLPTGAFVGYSGLRHVQVGGAEELEILYALHAQFWNQGYATEMATRLCTLALDEICAPDVVAFTLPANHASRRVMEKAGLRYERDVDWRNIVHVLYRRRRADGGSD
jgi:RimJ/RimL family protein N-acetyltransferase